MTVLCVSQLIAIQDIKVFYLNCIIKHYSNMNNLDTLLLSSVSSARFQCLIFGSVTALFLPFASWCLQSGRNLICQHERIIWGRRD